MPTNPPEYYNCGFRYPGWLRTPVPALGAPPSLSTVCFRTSSGSVCGWQTQVLVCSCSYDAGATVSLMYKLPRAYSCDAGYCGAFDYQDGVMSPLPPPSSPSPPPRLPPSPKSPPPPAPPPSPPSPLSPPPLPEAAMCHSSCPNPLGVVELTQSWRLTSYHTTNYWSDYQTRCRGNPSVCYSPPTQSTPSGGATSGGVWVRFSGDAGIRMASYPPSYQRCGGQRGAWLSTPMPAVGAPREWGRACFPYTSNRHCYTAFNIGVCTCTVDGVTPIYLYELYRPHWGDDTYCGTFDNMPPPPPPTNYG